ncbi:hypothetical protein [Haloferula luteola]|nr:hypothetical protein [Haloferula luteola]
MKGTFGLAWAFVMTATAEARWVPPQEGLEPFRRERVPLDAAILKRFSHELIERVPSPSDDPYLARRAAQLLGLALALDPGSPEARAKLDAWEEGRPLAEPSSAPFPADLQKAWAWLLDSEAGVDGHRLAERLSVALELPTAHEAMATKSWEPWVGDLERFQDARPTVEPQIPENAPLPAITPQLDEVSIGIPNVTPKPDGSEQDVSRGLLRFEVQKPGEESPEMILELPPQLPGSMGRFRNTLLPWMQSEFGTEDSPQGHWRWTLVEKTPRVSSSSFALFDAAARMLVQASVQGVPLDPEVTLLAEADAEGRLVLPGLFWETLRHLEPGNGEKWILPAEAEPLLKALIPLDQSDFFLQHELLLARDLTEAIQLAAIDPGPEVRDAERNFHEIRVAQGTHSLGSFLAREETRQLLLGIVTQLPQHASASLLALRSSSQWPRRLERKMYAREIRMALAGLKPVLSPPWAAEKADPKALLEADSQCRERLAEIEGLCEAITDRAELHDLAFNTSKALGQLAGQLRRNDRSVMSTTTTAELFGPVYRNYCETLFRLTKVIGDEGDYPMPPPSTP